ncbi:hypothetical protein HYH03_012394 [Edaphochlamys debaryana]|uniref:UvrD-like helicase ATP-binding domain-containing protein n=1 Tax=Edaphochlamys debaryana TaxID=47281 RepID=A0A835XS12_9CHLO|nr:hypothetical protein HYH03_012394 [Edaphochlamys debaryana]|eukprot:KAG2489168.1 hypothetical protein HYH03_012394 [Edaphochlamys debaryana]
MRDPWRLGDGGLSGRRRWWQRQPASPGRPSARQTRGPQLWRRGPALLLLAAAAAWLGLAALWAWRVPLCSRVTAGRGSGTSGTGGGQGVAAPRASGAGSTPPPPPPPPRPPPPPPPLPRVALLFLLGPGGRLANEALWGAWLRGAERWRLHGGPPAEAVEAALQPAPGVALHGLLPALPRFDEEAYQGWAQQHLMPPGEENGDASAPVGPALAAALEGAAGELAAELVAAGGCGGARDSGEAAPGASGPLALTEARAAVLSLLREEARRTSGSTHGALTRLVDACWQRLQAAGVGVWGPATGLPLEIAEVGAARAAAHSAERALRRRLGLAPAAWEGPVERLWHRWRAWRSWQPPPEEQRLIAAAWREHACRQAAPVTPDGGSAQGQGCSHPLLQPGAGGWRRLFSLYAHAADPAVRAPAGSLLCGATWVARVNTSRGYGQPALAQASRGPGWHHPGLPRSLGPAAGLALLAAALGDPLAARFVLLSDTSVPLRPAPLVWAQLLWEERSRVDACRGRQGDMDEGRWRPAMATPHLNLSQWRKSSQWFALTRPHAALAAADRHVAEAFARHCFSRHTALHTAAGPAPAASAPAAASAALRSALTCCSPPCVADEHLLPTLLAAYGRDAEAGAGGQTDCLGEATYADWSGAGGWHPRTFLPADLQPSLRGAGGGPLGGWAWGGAGGGARRVSTPRASPWGPPPSALAPGGARMWGPDEGCWGAGGGGSAAEASLAAVAARSGEAGLGAAAGGGPPKLRSWLEAAGYQPLGQRCHLFARKFPALTAAATFRHALACGGLGLGAWCGQQGEQGGDDGAGADDVFNEELLAGKLQPLPETYTHAADWAGRLLPFVPEETRAGLQQQLSRLPALTWLPLEGPPRLRRGDGRGGGARAGRGEGEGGGEECVASLSLQAGGGGLGGVAGQLAAQAAAAAAGEGESASAPGPAPPPLKPTDQVLLTCSRAKDVGAVAGAAYLLGMVKPRRRGDEEDEEEEGAEAGELRATVWLPWGAAEQLERAGVDTGLCGSGPGASDAPWFAVRVGSLATPGRVWRALRDFAGEDPAAPAPRMLRPLLAGGQGAPGGGSAAAWVAAAEVEEEEGGDVGPGAVRSSASADHALSAAVAAYCRTVRRLNPSQAEAVTRAARAFTRLAPAGGSGGGRERQAAGWRRGGSGSGCSASSAGSEVVLVQGPPGTGKTATVASLLSVLCGLGAGGEGDALVVCAPTNAAAAEAVSRFLQLLGEDSAAAPQQFCAQPGLAGALAAGGLGGTGAAGEMQAAPPLLPGDVVLIGSAERLDPSGAGGGGGGAARAAFLPARARRLVAALAGPEGWRGAACELRRLLSAAGRLHAEALEAERRAAREGPGGRGGRAAAEAAPVPASLGAYVKQRLPGLVRAVRAAAATLLADLPSAAWGGAPGQGRGGGAAAGSWERVQRGRAAVEALAGACLALQEAVDGATGAAVARAFESPPPSSSSSAAEAALLDHRAASSGALALPPPPGSPALALTHAASAPPMSFIPPPPGALLPPPRLAPGAPLPSLPCPQLLPDAQLGPDPGASGGGQSHEPSPSPFTSWETETPADSRTGSPGGGGAREPVAAALRRALAALDAAEGAVAVGRVLSAPTQGVLESFCLSHACVLFSTVSALGSARVALSGLRAAAAVVDEAAQLPEAELAVPLAAWRDSLRLLVLVGDPRQLPATVLSPAAAAGGYGRSAFERLQAAGRGAVLLDTQYRMHPAISAWPRERFYGGRVVDGPNVSGPSYAGAAGLLGLPWGPLAVVDTGAEAREEREECEDGGGEEGAPAGAGAAGSGARAVPGPGSGGTSWRNPTEAALAVALAARVAEAWRRLRAAGTAGTPGAGEDCAARHALLAPDRVLTIGIISPYRAQVEAIAPRAAALASPPGAPGGGVRVAVRSVDGFQGGEVDVVILSAVRSNPRGAVGFTADPRRLCVAATRARHGLVVLGSAATLGRDTLWAALLEHARARGVLLTARDRPELGPGFRALEEAARRRADIRTAARDLWANAPWRVLYKDALQPSLLRLPLPQRLKVLDQVLLLARGRFPRRPIPLAAVRPPYRPLLHALLLEGGRLALLWSVALHRGGGGGGGGWSQALQLWDVAVVRRDGRALEQWVRRIEAEYDTYTPEHLAEIGRRDTTDRGLTLPRTWPGGDLPFPRMRPQRERRPRGQGQGEGQGTAAPTRGGAAAAGEGEPEANAGSESDAEGSSGGEEEGGGGPRRLDGGAARLAQCRQYLLDAAHAPLLCSAAQGAAIEAMFEMTPEQQQVVNDPRSLILIGRSGTGKTSVIMARVLRMEAGFAGLGGDREEGEEGEEEEVEVAGGVGGGRRPRQLLVTLSPKLAAATAKYLRGALATLRAAAEPAPADAEATVEANDEGGGDGNGEDDDARGGGGGGGGGGLSALVDEEEAARLVGTLPERLADVPSSACPLVLDLRTALRLLDASLLQPFAEAQRGRAAAAAERRREGARRGAGAGSVGVGPKAGLRHTVRQPGAPRDVEWDDDDWALEEAEAEEEGGAAPPAPLGQVPLVEVDYGRFADAYWPHFSTDLRRGISDPALVWREVQTCIRGSLAALRSPGTCLGMEEYVALAGTRAGADLDEATRERVYTIFLRYQRAKASRGEYDVGDLVAHLHAQLQGAGGFPRESAFRFVYVDDVQDLTPAQIALFRYLCVSPEDGLVLAGDTAQTLAAGVSFRFEALKDLLRALFLEHLPEGERRPPDVTPLLENFRTHAAISRLAHSGVLEPLLHFFPNTFDRLPPETSRIRGPKPLFLLPSCGDVTNLLTDGGGGGSGQQGGSGSRGAGGGASGGSEVVVLVPSEEAKRALKERLAARGGGEDVLVLTALESKGLEFKVVLLHNFLSASRLKPDKWRLLRHVAAAEGLLRPEDLAPGSGSHPAPRFDAGAHAALAPELKALYVAVTRAREDLIIVEEREEAVEPLLELWGGLRLVDARREADAGVLGRLQRRLSASDLRRRAQELANAELYADAANLFDRLGKLTRAAQCFEAAERWGEAGDVRRRLGEGLAAAECFERVGRWGDAAECYCELPRLDPSAPAALVDRAAEACTQAGLFEAGVAALGRWAAAAPGSPAGRRAGVRRGRLVSLGALHWKGRAGGGAEMMKLVRLMGGEEQRRWLERYRLYDELLQLDIEAGRHLAAAATLERKGDPGSAERAVGLYLGAGEGGRAAELLLRRARGGVLWGGAKGDWPPPQGAASAAAKAVARAAEVLLGQDPSIAAGGSGSLPELFGGPPAYAQHLLELELLQCLTGEDRGGGGCGGGRGPRQRWESWCRRLRSPEGASMEGCLVALCMLRLLCGEAVARAEAHITSTAARAAQASRPLTQQQQRQAARAGPSAAGGAAKPPAPAAPPAADTAAVTSLAADLLPLWAAYRRLLADLLRLLARQQAAGGASTASLPPRDARLLAALQACHGVGSAAWGGGGGASSGLVLSCPPGAAWLRLAAGGSGSGSGSGNGVATQMGWGAFLGAAAGYWLKELGERCGKALAVLQALAGPLEPCYAAFAAHGQAGAGLEIRDARRPAGRAGDRGGGEAPEVDATQLRAQLLAAAAQAAEELARTKQGRSVPGLGGRAPSAPPPPCPPQLLSALEQLFRATAAPPLAAAAHGGSLHAARSAAAAGLERDAGELLAGAAARRPRAVMALQHSGLERLWERPAHSRLELEETGRLLLLMPLLPPGWMGRMAAEGRVDWEVPLGLLAEQLSAWQVPLKAALYTDSLRTYVPLALEAPGSFVGQMALSCVKALLDLHRGFSVTPRPSAWCLWEHMAPLTFIALLERKVLLALAVASGGLHGLLLPASLAQDHLSQLGVADLATCAVRHSGHVAPHTLAALADVLAEACALLERLLLEPARLCPADSRHPPAPAPPPEPPRGEPSQASPGTQPYQRLLRAQQAEVAQYTRLLKVYEAQAQQRREAQAQALAAAVAALQSGSRLRPEQAALGAVLRRALVLLLTIALNTRPLPPLPRHLQRPQQPPPPPPLEVVRRLLMATQPPARPAPVGPGAARFRAPPPPLQPAPSALALALPLLPATLRLLLERLRIALRAQRSGGGGGSGALEAAELGREFSSAMVRGRDRLVRLLRRSLPLPPAMRWSQAAHRGYNIEQWRELPPLEPSRGAPRKAGSRKPKPRQVVFFALPPELLTAAAEDLAGEEGDDDHLHPSAATETAAAAATAPPTIGDSNGGEGEGGAEGGPVDDEAARRRAELAAANQLGRRCFTATRLWLSRARQQVLLPALSPLQRARREARAALRALEGGARPSAALQGYAGQFLDLACPLQVEAAALQAALDRTAQSLLARAEGGGGGSALGGAEEAEARAKAVQALDLVFECRDRLGEAAALLDLDREQRHVQLDATWLVGSAVLPLQQALYDVRQELGEHLVEEGGAQG